MNFKKFSATIALLFFLCGISPAQTLSQPMQAAMDACVQLSKAIKSGSTTGLKAANQKFKDCALGDFSFFHSADDNQASLDGHFVFDEVFVDSLIAGGHVYDFARRYADQRGTREIVRGSSESHNPLLTNCAVKGGVSAKFNFRAHNKQDLVFVTEPDGLITVRIHDLTNDRWFNDTKDTARGRSSRQFSFELGEKVCTLEVEVINCGKKDISFAVISN